MFICLQKYYLSRFGRVFFHSFFPPRIHPVVEPDLDHPPPMCPHHLFHFLHLPHLLQKVLPLLPRPLCQGLLSTLQKHPQLVILVGEWMDHLSLPLLRHYLTLTPSFSPSSQASLYQTSEATSEGFLILHPLDEVQGFSAEVECVN